MHFRELFDDNSLWCHFLGLLTEKLPDEEFHKLLSLKNDSSPLHEPDSEDGSTSENEHNSESEYDSEEESDYHDYGITDEFIFNDY